MIPQLVILKPIDRCLDGQDSPTTDFLLPVMPAYVVHGFRWPRSAIRIHIILNNIDDAAAEYIVSPGTSASLLQSLRDLYPNLMKALPNLRFVEQYDPADVSASALSQPFAFVADKVENCRLSVDIGEVMGQGVATDGWAALVELRDQLAPGEKVGWWVVCNGDERRPKPPGGSEHSDERDNEDFPTKKSRGKLKKLLSKG
ncbi:hypothetical protein MMC11_001419 [Xylographa trunciseda]|nr:hypothetical protein [Xylographa trunciseda]